MHDFFVRGCTQTDIITDKQTLLHNVRLGAGNYDFMHRNVERIPVFCVTGRPIIASSSITPPAIIPPHHHNRALPVTSTSRSRFNARSHNVGGDDYH